MAISLLHKSDTDGQFYLEEKENSMSGYVDLLSSLQVLFPSLNIYIRTFSCDSNLSVYIVLCSVFHLLLLS